MEEQIEKIKSSKNESKDPSKTSAAAPEFLYLSIVSSATTPVLYPCPDCSEDLLDTWDPPKHTSLTCSPNSSISSNSI